MNIRRKTFALTDAPKNPVSIERDRIVAQEHKPSELDRLWLAVDTQQKAINQLERQLAAEQHTSWRKGMLDRIFSADRQHAPSPDYSTKETKHPTEEQSLRADEAFIRGRAQHQREMASVTQGGFLNKEHEYVFLSGWSQAQLRREGVGQNPHTGEAPDPKLTASAIGRRRTLSEFAEWSDGWNEAEKRWAAQAAQYVELLEKTAVFVAKVVDSFEGIPDVSEHDAKDLLTELYRVVPGRAGCPGASASKGP